MKGWTWNSTASWRNPRVAGTGAADRVLFSPVGAGDPPMNFTAAVVATCLACPVKAVPASPHSAGAIVNWWGEVRRGLAEGEYHASDDGRGLQAPNRAHDLRTYFEPVGVRVHSRTAVGSPRLVSLLPVCLGRGDALVPIAAGTVSHAGARPTSTGTASWASPISWRSWPGGIKGVRPLSSGGRYTPAGEARWWSRATVTGDTGTTEDRS